MAKMRRIFTIFVVIIFTIVGPILFMFASAGLAVRLGWRSYPIYFACQLLASFLVLWLYNPAKHGFVQRLMERFTKFDLSRPLVARFIGASKILAIFAVNYVIGPFVGAMLIKRLGYKGAKAYAYAALADAICVIIGNTIYILALQKLFN